MLLDAAWGLLCYNGVVAFIRFIDSFFIRSENVMENKTIRFNGKPHEEFYKLHIGKCRYQDSYHDALIYTLGISEDCRNQINRIYDFETGCVKPDCLHEGWITSGSAKVIRLAFNLYNGGTPSTIPIDENDTDSLTQEYRCYLPSNIFCCPYAPYFLEALKIRFPECFF